MPLQLLSLLFLFSFYFSSLSLLFPFHSDGRRGYKKEASRASRNVAMGDYQFATRVDVREIPGCCPWTYLNPKRVTWRVGTVSTWANSRNGVSWRGKEWRGCHGCCFQLRHEPIDGPECTYPVHLVKSPPLLSDSLAVFRVRWAAVTSYNDKSRPGCPRVSGQNKELSVGIGGCWFDRLFLPGQYSGLWVPSSIASQCKEPPDLM